jgi:hypothetical protein
MKNFNPRGQREGLPFISAYFGFAEVVGFF